MSIYLELKDVDIRGDVTSKGYEDQMKIESLQFKASKDRQYGHDNVHKSAILSDTIISKFVDIASPSLMQATFKGDHFVTAIFRFTRDVGANIKTYMDYELSDAYIIDYSLSADPEIEPKEIITFTYSKIKYSYVDYKLDGKPKSKQTVTYDRNKNRVK